MGRFQLLDTNAGSSAPSSCTRPAGAAAATQVRARHRGLLPGASGAGRPAGSMTAAQTGWLNRLAAEDRENLAGGSRFLLHPTVFLHRTVLPHSTVFPHRPQSSPTGTGARARARPADDAGAAALLADDRPVHRGQALAWPWRQRSRPGSRDKRLGGIRARASSRYSRATFRDRAARCSRRGDRAWPRARGRTRDLAGARHRTARGMLAFYSGDLLAAQAEFEAGARRRRAGRLQRPDGAGYLQPARVGLPADLRALTGRSSSARSAYGAATSSVSSGRAPSALWARGRPPPLAVPATTPPRSEDAPRPACGSRGASATCRAPRDVLRPAFRLPGGHQ